MKIEVDDNGEIVLKEVFSGVGLESGAGEHFGICMRDSGFEFNYGGYWYEAKEDRLSLLGPDENEEESPDEFELDRVYKIDDYCVSLGVLWKFVGKSWRTLPGPGYHSFAYIQRATIGTYPAEDWGWRKVYLDD